MPLSIHSTDGSFDKVSVSSLYCTVRGEGHGTGVTDITGAEELGGGTVVWGFRNAMYGVGAGAVKFGMFDAVAGH